MHTHILSGKHLVFIFLFAFSFLAKSQDIVISYLEKRKDNCDKYGCLKSWGIFTSIDLTYTGYNSVLGMEYEKNKTSFYLGPKISLNNTYIPTSGFSGGNLGYRYLFLTNHTRWRFFFNVDYQIVLYSAFKAQGETGTKKNYIHEINFSYGVRFKLSDRFYLGQSIGAGKYFESYYNYKTNERTMLSGYDAQLKLFIKYKLFKNGS